MEAPVDLPPSTLLPQIMANDSDHRHCQRYLSKNIRHVCTCIQMYGHTCGVVNGCKEEQQMKHIDVELPVVEVFLL